MVASAKKGLFLPAMLFCLMMLVINVRHSYLFQKSNSVSRIRFIFHPSVIECLESSDCFQGSFADKLFRICVLQQNYSATSGV